MEEQKIELKIINMADIQSQEIEWLWYPFIPYGKLTIIQGDPGDGKTTLVLNLAAKLSKGIGLDEDMQVSEPMNIIYQTAEDGLADTVPLWGFSVRQGTVLYLALEDDYARLQKRLSQMFGMEGSENFYFATKSKSLNDGLEKQLVTFVTEHKDARLIIIDTLQKVREVGGDKFSYASDYEIVTKLKAFSDKYGICFLVVHHTRKMESSDSFDMISGTNGLLGAADGAFVMQKEKRTDNKAVLEVAGRDQQDQKLWLNFNRERCVWELIKTETELWKEPEDPVLEKIKELVTETTPEWAGTATELVEVLQVEMQPNALSRKLNVSLERLILEYGIQYKAERGHDGRKIRLAFVGNQV